MNLKTLKSVNNGHDVMWRNHYECLRDIDNVVRMVGLFAPLSEVAKYMLRAKWEAVGDDNRTFTKDKAKFAVPGAVEDLPFDNGHELLVVLAKEPFAQSFAFLHQFARTYSGSRTPAVVVTPCNTGAPKNTVWGFGNIDGRNDCYPTALREIIASATGIDPGDIDNKYSEKGHYPSGFDWTKYVADTLFTIANEVAKEFGVELEPVLPCTRVELLDKIDNRPMSVTIIHEEEEDKPNTGMLHRVTIRRDPARYSPVYIVTNLYGGGGKTFFTKDDLLGHFSFGGGKTCHLVVHVKGELTYRAKD